MLSALSKHSISSHHCRGCESIRRRISKRNVTDVNTIQPADALYVQVFEDRWGDFEAMEFEVAMSLVQAWPPGELLQLATSGIGKAIDVLLALNTVLDDSDGRR